MAAENWGRRTTLAGLSLSSMRPRRMAAENDVRAVKQRQPAGVFNEAAAHGRGKCWRRRARH